MYLVVNIVSVVAYSLKRKSLGNVKDFWGKLKGKREDRAGQQLKHFLKSCVRSEVKILIPSNIELHIYIKRGKRSSSSVDC